LYLTHTYPNISFVVGRVAQYIQTPHESHWKVVKRILRNIWDIIQFGIHYSSWGNICCLVSPILIGGNPNDGKSTTCYVFSLGSVHNTWACKKHQALVLSSTEAEYRATINASQESLWL
jgi:hypothetical protein